MYFNNISFSSLSLNILSTIYSSGAISDQIDTLCSASKGLHIPEPPNTKLHRIHIAYGRVIYDTPYNTSKRAEIGQYIRVYESIEWLKISVRLSTLRLTSPVTVGRLLSLLIVLISKCSLHTLYWFTFNITLYTS